MRVPLEVNLCRDRSSEARKLAEQAYDSDSRWRLLRIASDFEKLADQAEAQHKLEVRIASHPSLIDVKTFNLQDAITSERDRHKRAHPTHA